MKINIIKDDKKMPIGHKIISYVILVALSPFIVAYILWDMLNNNGHVSEILSIEGGSYRNKGKDVVFDGMHIDGAIVELQSDSINILIPLNLPGEAQGRLEAILSAPVCLKVSSRTLDTHGIKQIAVGGCNVTQHDGWALYSVTASKQDSNKSQSEVQIPEALLIDVGGKYFEIWNRKHCVYQATAFSKERACVLFILHMISKIK